MNLRSSLAPRRSPPSAESGSAILVILILLLAMSAIVMSNQLVLRHLKREIKLVEQQQLKKFEKPIQPKKSTSTERVEFGPPLND